MKTISLLLLLLLAIPVATAEFGYVPKQTINDVEYDSILGKYTQTTIFLENKVNETITINLKGTANIYTESQVELQPLQRMNIPVSILVLNDKQIETISSNEEGKNFGGVTEITINAKSIGTKVPDKITTKEQLEEIKTFARTNEYECLSNETALICISPLKQVIIPIEGQTINWGLLVGGLIFCILMVSVLLYIFRPKDKNEHNQGS
jgi:hypothetical protein